MGKNNWLWVIATLAVGYFLMPEKVKEQATNALGGGGISFFPEIKMPDLTMPQFSLQMPNINLPESPINLSGLSESLKGIIPSMSQISIPETSIPKLPEISSLIPSSPSGGPDIPGIRQKAAIPAGVIGGGAAALITRGLPALVSRLMPAVAIKGGTTALKAIPYAGWAYAAADVGATIFELVSGKNIAGNWLGWGEVLNPKATETKEPTPAIRPDVQASKDEVKSGTPESRAVVTSDKVTATKGWTEPELMQGWREAPWTARGFEFK